MEKEKKDDLREEVEDLKKSNKIMKGLLIVLVVAILVSACFGIGFIAGEKLADKENDLLEENKKEEDKEETKTEESEKEEEKEPEKEENKVDNTISDALRKDLDKKVNITERYAGTGFYMNDINSKMVIANASEQDYPYFAYATYQYYIYKTGKTIKEWSSKDKNYGPCYVDGQNGYCYPMDKADVLKYEKELYNMGVKIFDLKEGYSIVKGDKVYVTSVPWNGSLSVEQKNVVSVVKNNDTIEYIANYVVGNYVPDESSNVNMTIKYIFKANTDGNFYLHSFEKM